MAGVEKRNYFGEMVGDLRGGLRWIKPLSWFIFMKLEEEAQYPLCVLRCYKSLLKWDWFSLGPKAETSCEKKQ